jgi:hypothetical protein
VSWGREQLSSFALGAQDFGWKLSPQLRSGVASPKRLNFGNFGIVGISGNPLHCWQFWQFLFTILITFGQRLRITT